MDMAFFMNKLSNRMIVMTIMFFLILSFAQDVVYGQISDKDLYAKAAVLMDGESGRVLFDKNGNIPLANASTTKILTCIICLEESKLEDIVTVSKKASQQPKVHLGMNKGDQFYVKDLIYAMMLESYNDCAVALAEYVSDGLDEFSVLMNQRAEEIGCAETYFLTPNGLDAESENNFHHTSAIDLCKIMKYCCWDSVKSDLFLEITQTNNYEFEDLNGKKYYISNKNAFLSMMPEAISGKTGFTSKAGYCYVAAIESKGRKYVLALLACGWPNHKTYKWQDAKKLFNYGIDNYKVEEVLYPNNGKEICVSGGRKKDATIDDWQKDCMITASLENKNISHTLLLSDSDSIYYLMDIPKKIYYEVSENDMIGKCKCYVNGEIFQTERIIVMESVKIWDFPYLFKCFLDSFCLKKR